MEKFYREVEGNLITLALGGEFDVIAHGCNCYSRMGSGLAPQMAKFFGADTFPMEKIGPSVNKLGCIDHQGFRTGLMRDLVVVNAYTQIAPGVNIIDSDLPPLDYEALTLCMRKINQEFRGKHIGLPQIGAGLAGGDWEEIKKIIQSELKDCLITVVIFKN